MVMLPDPDMTVERMLQRAESLRDSLRAQQDEVEERGTYSPEMHAAFTEAGFYRIMQPRRFGGYEFDLTSFFRVIMAVAQGCPSTAWCLSLGAGHSFLIGSHWSEQAQAELFGANGHFVASHRAAPEATCERVDGGYIVDGVMRYCSGVSYATHIMGGATVKGEELNEQGRPRIVVFVSPREQCEVLDDWGRKRMLGLNGTGSNSVRIKRVFVPEHHVTPYDWVTKDLSQGTPGTRLHGNPMYLGRTMTHNAGELAGVMVGLARAAFDEYEKVVRTKKVPIGPPILRSESAEFLRYFGHAMGLVDCAEALVIQAGEQYAEYCRRWQQTGQEFTGSDDLRANALVLHANELVEEAMRVMFSTAGSSEACTTGRMTRYMRDMTMQRTHLCGWGTLVNSGEIRARTYLFGSGTIA